MMTTRVMTTMKMKMINTNKKVNLMMKMKMKKNSSHIWRDKQNRFHIQRKSKKQKRKNQPRSGPANHPNPRKEKSNPKLPRNHLLQRKNLQSETKRNHLKHRKMIQKGKTKIDSTCLNKKLIHQLKIIPWDFSMNLTTTKIQKVWCLQNGAWTEDLLIWQISRM